MRNTSFPSGDQHRARQSDDPPLPEYISGDECLFCHRFQTGQNWQENRHNRTVRRIESDEGILAMLRRREGVASFAETIEFVMGGKNRVRFLKKGQGYGRLDLLTTELVPERPASPEQLLHAENAEWDREKFAASCAGCHATQTNSRTQSFAAV